MRPGLRHRSEGGERGAIAVMTAFLTVGLLAVVALGVDTTVQVNQLQKLHDTVDAAAHAGAYRLPASGTLAASDARAMAAMNDPAAVPDVAFFCVVASRWSGTAWVVDATQIPATCNPGSAGGTYTGYRCNSRICTVPCNPAAGDACNTVKVADTEAVPFSFAPAIGIHEGSTGAVTSAACKGSCGTVPLNPMDVAVVADRTGSMSATDITAMITGIKSMFQVMTPSQQYVSLGTIGRSKQGAASTTCSGSTLKALSEPSSSATLGPWMPVPFSADYLNSGATSINTNSTLVNAVECLKNSSGTGTHLAAPMKSAARYLLGYDANNIGSLPARTGIIRKAIIFETDGAPNESINGGSATLNIAGDIGSTASDDTPCTNFKTVAANAKAAGILAVTVAFNVSTATKCSGASGSARLDQTMAAAASPTASGAASAANFDCATTAGRNSENADGDYFFCAGTGTDMAAIFKTAFVQIANGIRLIQLP